MARNENIKLDELPIVIEKALQDYSQDVTDAIKKEVVRVCEETAKELKQISPRSKKNAGSIMPTAGEVKRPMNPRMISV